MKEVNGTGIVIEPPIILDWKRRTFKVYAQEPDGVRLLGPLRRTNTVVVRNEFGTEVTRAQTLLTDDITGVQPGSEVGLTRLEKGRDTVFITNVAYASVER